MNSGFSLGVNQPLQIAQKQLQEGNVEYATQILEKILKENPENLDAMHLMSMVEYMKGNLSGAIDYCQQILQHEPDSIPVLNNLGNFYKVADKPELARQAYKRVLKIDAKCFPALFNLGNVHFQLGDSKEAVNNYRNAIKIDSEHPDCFYNMGIALGNLGDFEEAAASLEQALALDSNHKEALCQLGTTYFKMNAFEKAIEAFEKAVDSDDPDATVLNNFGVALTNSGDTQRAVEVLNEALKKEPQNLDFRNNLGVAQMSSGDLNASIMSFKTIINQDSTNKEAHRNLAVVLHQKDKLKEAEVSFGKALELDPQYYDALMDLSVCLHEQKRDSEALAIVRKAGQVDSHKLAPRIARVLLQLKHFSETEEELENQYEEYKKNLDELETFLETEDWLAFDDLENALNFSVPFCLILQDKNLVEVQKQFARIIQTVSAKRYPQWQEAKELKAEDQGKKIHLGVLSHSFSYDSAYKMITKGWISGLDREKFRITAYSTGLRREPLVDSIIDNFDEYVEINDFDTMASRIWDDRPDILLYPSIGMEAPSLKFASLRLAPLQCAGWGHPMTTGLTTVDTMFISDWLEPKNAHEHYGEKTIRLPKLGSYYDPVIPEAVTEKLQSYGVRSDAIKFLCVQTLHKYLPQFDKILVEIAQQVSSAQFIFASREVTLANQLTERLENAFSKENLIASDFVTFLPFLPAAEYQGLCSISHVYLDTPVNSGLLSTIEAIETGIVPVTMPGEFMRSRQTSVLLEKLGVTDSIVENLDQYVEVAVELANNKDKREKMKAEILENKEKLYRHKEVQVSFSKHLESLLKEKLDG